MSQLKTAKRRITLSTTLLSTIAMSSIVTAHAQSNSSSQFNYTAPLSLLSAIDNTEQDAESQNGSLKTATLNWRKSSHDFTFELPAENLTDNIELLLSANPHSNVNPRTPLTVQFNNDAPILLNVNGQGFDARIKLDRNKARSSGNIIRVNYSPKTDADCIGPQDGGWDIDLKTSKIAIRSRAKRRALQFREIDAHLSNPGLAPRRVNLIATGNNAVQLQALAAQGIGLRMDTLPDFSTDRGNSDFEIIMARRSDLYQYIGDDKLIAGRGSAIIIPRGRPVKLIFTGDTEAEILAGVKSFAQRELPMARRSMTSLGEMRLQTPLKSNLVKLSTTEAIADLPNATSFSNWTGDDWASGPKSLRFDVTDPTAMSGEILLRLASSKNVSPNSKLHVKLNGESLGITVLDKRRKSVAFEIKPGTLRGKDNMLTLMPDLNPNDTTSCGLMTGPNFHLGQGSKIILKTETPSAPTELSRMTATAVPFSNAQGAQSYITMPGSDFDFNTSLKVLARLAKTSGEGLVDADYARNVNLDRAADKHILFIGPSDRLPLSLIKNAPRALTTALRGQAFEGDNLISANIQKFASLDSSASFELAAKRLSQSRRIQAGGVAALYPSSHSDAHIIGVITNTPGQTFNVSAERITQEPYWSEIKGGVARWNKGSVLSVQTAQSVSGYSEPKQPNTASVFNFDTRRFDNAFNSTLDMSRQLWDGLSAFSSQIAKKVKNLIVADETSTSNISEDRASGNDEVSDIQTPKIQAPKIETPRIMPPKAQGSDPLKAATPAAENGHKGWVNAAQSQLYAANDWASRLGGNIRQSAADFKLSSAVAGVKDSLRSVGQTVKNIFQPNSSAQSGQSFMRQMLHPVPIVMVLVFLFMLFGLIFSRTSPRARRVK